VPTMNDPMVGPGDVRPIVARWVITGNLVLESATHLGNGEQGEAVDMPLLRDRLQGKPLLTGASLAGGLRSYLLDWLDGYGRDEPLRSAASHLFGGTRGDDEGSQSPLIVFDSLATLSHAIEIRDGVAIKPETGLAEDHKKFDIEILPARTKFPLRFELVISDPQEEQAQMSLLATALKGLEAGDIAIGARRSRGLGACQVKDWQAKRFELSTQQGWFSWLGSDYDRPLLNTAAPQAKIDQALKTAHPTLTLNTQPDERKQLTIIAHLMLDGGLLVRSPGTDAAAADATHLTSSGKPVLPGTGLGGALRTRALRIAYVVRNGKGDAEQWVERLLGPRLEGTTNPNFQSRISRLWVSEKEIHNGTSLRPNRIKSDRFTGGVVDGALFDEEPVYGGHVEVKMELRNPQDGEAGLVLLLLKDLLTGDLSVGGTSSVGRGVVKGTADVIMDGNKFPLDPTQRADETTRQALNQEVQKFYDATPLKEGME
jgi:CRISPR/Cas system CSM-associated protein Csm3 (group 7 of RAMP superfamily)